jgi:sugar/nucleoside kinase (ribokinase family)
MSAGRAGVPVLLNLGGDRLSDAIAEASVEGGQLAAVQTSLEGAEGGPEQVLHRAHELAGELFELLNPVMAVVTVGRLGAAARTAGGQHYSATDQAPVQYVHGGGAAFSAGLAHAILAGRDVDAALGEGCASGAAHCQDKIAAHRMGSKPDRWSPAPDRTELTNGR